eukprot:7329124-Ditylum_brightwellii.AAC.1
MEKNMKEYSKHHFSQVKPTPFCQQPLKMLIGFTGEDLLAQQLKKETAELENSPVDKYTMGVLNELQWKPIFPPKNSDKLTWSYVQSGFKIWKKKTATFPFGSHLGCYKAWILQKRT